jgi:hypothetical protein
LRKAPKALRKRPKIDCCIKTTHDGTVIAKESPTGDPVFISSPDVVRVKKDNHE